MMSFVTDMLVASRMMNDSKCRLKTPVSMFSYAFLNIFCYKTSHLQVNRLINQCRVLPLSEDILWDGIWFWKSMA